MLLQSSFLFCSQLTTLSCSRQTLSRAHSMTTTAFLPAPSLPQSTRRRPRPVTQPCPRCATPSPRATPSSRPAPFTHGPARPRAPSVTRRAFLALLAAAVVVPTSSNAHQHPYPDIDLTPPNDPDQPAWSERQDSFLDPLDHIPTTHASPEDYLRVQLVPPTDLRVVLEDYARNALILALPVVGVTLGTAIASRTSARVELPVHYDLTALHRYFSPRPDALARRFALFAREAAQFALGLTVDRLAATLDDFATTIQIHPRQWAVHRAAQRTAKRAIALRDTITRLGPALIKLGQAAASRPDLFPAPVVRELQRLQDDVTPPFPASVAFAVIEREIRAPVHAIFDEIEEKAVAGASLGMVFKAVLDGMPVAVKVQRPDVAETIALDCYIVRSFAAFATEVFQLRTDWRAAVDEYATRLFEELDYTNELNNMMRFQQMYGDIKGVYLPEVFPHYSSRRVLVTEWVDGEKLIDDNARVKREDISVVKTGIRFALLQLLDKGLLHADMHNGNMLRTKSGYLAYIDFGLVSEVPLSVRESIVCALMHLMHGDYALLAESFGGLALMRTDEVEMDLPVLTEALREVFEVRAGDAPVRSFTLIGVAGKLLSLGAQFPLVFGDYFLSNLRCLAMLEGLAVNADPSFSIVSLLYPYVVRRVLSGSSSRFRTVVEGLAYDSYGRVRWARLERLLRDERIAAVGAEQAGGDVVLHFLGSNSGRFLRGLVIQRYVSRVEGRWRRRIDRAFGQDVQRPVATRELDDGDEARGSAQGLLQAAPLSERMRVLACVTPSAVVSVARVTAVMMAYVMAHVVRMGVTVSQRPRRGGRTLPTVGVSGSGVSDVSTTEDVGEFEEGKKRRSEEERRTEGRLESDNNISTKSEEGTERWLSRDVADEQDAWRAFDSSFVQRTRVAKLTGRSMAE